MGEVDFDSVAERASTLTPVPGGVGPLTLATIRRNAVDLAARQAGVAEATTGQ